MSTKTQTYQESLKDLRANLTTILPKKALDIFDMDAKQLHNSQVLTTKIVAGEKAPDFSLSNALGQTIKLSDLRKLGPVVLVFYRGTWCPYCNLQLAHYQKSLPEFENLGARLVAISPQTPDESLSIKEKNELSFEVLSDNGNVVAKKYTTVFKNDDLAVQAMAELEYDFDSFYSDDSRELPVPAVFIIEMDGTISFAKSLGGDYKNRIEAQELLNVLKASR